MLEDQLITLPNLLGYVDSGDLDTGSLLDWTIPGRNDLPGEYEGLAAAYSLRKVSASYCY
jgi:hypothetical protein